MKVRRIYICRLLLFEKSTIYEESAIMWTLFFFQTSGNVHRKKLDFLKEIK